MSRDIVNLGNSDGGASVFAVGHDDTLTEETRDPAGFDPIGFDRDRVVWDPDYRREVIERLKRDDASQHAKSQDSYN